MADKYAVNYEDERFKNVENEKNQKLTETTNRYDNMINNTDKFYQDQINASKDWANKQTELQQQQTDFAIEKINQQRKQAEKEYKREQKASYVDYTKQVDPFSADAEKIAANGLQNSGYAESSRVSMWNAYQNRYAKARESFQNATINFDNGIKEAQLANSSALAQIAYNALQNQLELSLKGFEYKNQLTLQKEAQLQNINDNYYNRYQNVLAQINTEIERQRDIDNREAERLERQKQQEESNRQWWEEFNLKKQQYAIENSRAERQIQAAKANEGNYIVNSGSTNTNLITKINSGINTNAKKLMNTIMGWKVYAKQGIKKYQELNTPENISRIIRESYDNGDISDAEARLLFKQLNL